METTRGDLMLMEILQERKSITGFLDAVFGFLHRNTDFYLIKEDSNVNIGFERGLKEKITLDALRRYDSEFHMDDLPSEEAADYIPPALQEIEIETASSTSLTNSVPSSSYHNGSSSSENASAINSTSSSNSCIKKQKQFFDESDYKNGAYFETYCWSQTLKDVELYVYLPHDMRNAKILKVDVGVDSIQVSSSTPACPKNLLSGKLEQKVRNKEAIWTVYGDKLVITIDKCKERWWERLLTTEPSIDVKRLDCERFIDELPQESQTAIQKLRVEQLERENLKEKKKISQDKLEKLRQAWNEDGSPFKGTPFDPSRIDFR